MALAGGAEIIDVKDPSRGSLGAASTDVCRQIVSVVGHEVPVTVALGELAENPSAEPIESITYFKVGLAGEGGNWDWLPRWRQRAQSLSAPLLLVAYADADRANAPSPKQVIEAAEIARPPYLLLDTAIKDGRGLLEWVDVQVLREWRERLSAAGVGLALAGSIRADDMEWIVDVEPHVIAVRGAACLGSDRQARVESERVASLRRRLSDHWRRSLERSTLSMNQARSVQA